MRVLTGPPTQWEAEPRPRAVTIGVYDGLHQGHRHVLSLLRRAAAARGLECAVVTFHPHPLTVVAPEHAPRLLTSIEHRLELLADAGLDLAAVLPFDEAMRRRTSAFFAATVLSSALATRLVVVGEDFRFGHQRTGNVASLAELGDAHGFGVEVVPLVGGQAPVSSTRIRAMVASGDLDGAASLLGRPHEVRGPVVAGEGRGRGLGFPTANVAVPGELALPPSGVYAVRAGPGSGPLLPGVANLGRRPTFGGAAETLEVHLLEPPGDLYGTVLRVAFAGRLRAERQFAGPAELTAQIVRDLAAAREVLGL
ncbi:MAG: bifunctional riboflavin kinase/FAD synthetase [Actinobacteria bacterium]|nr:bifunctional riboflavin kinase/FAD synthetase [Actinomycetota bacterium]